MLSADSELWMVLVKYIGIIANWIGMSYGIFMYFKIVYT